MQTSYIKAVEAAAEAINALAGQLSKLLAAIEGKDAEKETIEDPQITLAAE